MGSSYQKIKEALLNEFFAHITESYLHLVSLYVNTLQQ